MEMRNAKLSLHRLFSMYIMVRDKIKYKVTHMKQNYSII